jgi:hemoglobin/transferrin/lactoferrin receptor protein
MSTLYRFGRNCGRIITFTAALSFASGVSAAVGTSLRVQGRVVRADDRGPIARAAVSLRGIPGDVRTDDQGRFTIPFPEPMPAVGAEVMINASAEGFNPASIMFKIGDPEPVIVLTPSAFVIPGTRDVVVEAAGLDRPAFELPYAGRSLNRVAVFEAEANGLNKAAAGVPGVSFVGGGFHSAPAIRGLARNRAVLLIDGVRTASIRTIGGHLGFIHPIAVENMEVLKGPFSTIYGHDAMSGVIQVDTLRPVVGESGFTLHGGGLARYESAAKSPNGAFFLAGGVPRATFVLSYGRTVEEDYRIGGGGILPRSGFTLNSLLAKTEIRPADGHRFEILYLRTDGRNIGKASGDPSLINVHPSETNDVASLRYEWTVGGPLIRSVEAHASRGLFTLAADFRTLSGSRMVQSLRDLGEDGYGFNLKTTLTPGTRAVVVAGLDGYFQENLRIEGVKNIYQTGQETPLSSVPLNEVPRAATRDVGLFVQGTYLLAPKWDFIFGLRGDTVGETVEEMSGARSRSFDPEWNGNLGAVYKISPSLRLGLNVGTAFRLPTPKDRYFIGQTPAGLNIGNPDLRSEHSLNADVVFRYRAAKSGSVRVEGSVAAFLNRFRDLIVIKWDKPTGNRTGVFQNAGRAEIYGLEGEVTLMSAGWAVTAAVTALGAAVHGNDEVLDDLPPWGGYLRLRRNLAGGAGWAAVEFRGATAERRTSAGDLPAPAFLTADLAAGWKIGRSWSLRASMENITDASYREFFDLPLIRRKGRSFSLSLAAGF